jgi:hypothetical protein
VQLATVPSFVQMFMLDPMVVLKAPVLLPSSLPMMLAMLFSNSTAMIGKVAHLRSVKTASLVLVVDSELVAVSVHVEALAAVLVVEAVDLEAAEASEAALVVVVDLVAAMEVLQEVALTVVQLLFLQFQTPSQTMLRLARREARQSTSAM